MTYGNCCMSWDAWQLVGDFLNYAWQNLHSSDMTASNSRILWQLVAFFYGNFLWHWQPDNQMDFDIMSVIYFSLLLQRMTTKCYFFFILRHGSPLQKYLPQSPHLHQEAKICLRLALLLQHSGTQHARWLPLIMASTSRLLHKVFVFLIKP